jgi:hypothetical protein
MLALRLIGAGAIVFLGPGLAVLRLLRLPLEWPERTVVAFACSYGWIFLLSVVLPLTRSTVDAAAVSSLALIAVLVFAGGVPAPPRRLRFRVDGADALLIAAIVALASSAWFVQSTLTGEEALDLASIMRFADGGAITFTNTSIMPDTKPVYLFQPYQLAIGMIARWSGTDPLVALIKLRPLFMFLSISFMYALIRQLTPKRAHAIAAIGVVLTFVVLDSNTWELASLIPNARRGGFSAGVCVPALLTLVLVTASRSDREDDGRRRVIGYVATCLLLLASMATHPLEVATVFFFAAGVVMAALLGVDRSREVRHSVLAALVMLIVVEVYVQVQRHAVPDVTQYEDQSKQVPRAELAGLMSTPRELVIGTMESKPRNVLANDVPSSTAAALAPAALVLAAVAAPYGSVVLFFALVPLLVAYASHGGFLVLSVLTSPATAGDWFGYVAAIGLIGVSIGLVGIAQSATSLATRATKMPRTAAAVVCVAVLGMWWLWVPRGTWLFELAAANPGVFVATAAVLGIPVTVVARWRPRDGQRDASSRARVCVAVTLAILPLLAVVLYRATVQPPLLVNVRWDPATDAVSRAAIEKQFSLVDGQDTSDAAVRTYTLTDTSRENVRALVQHPAVKDTVHIDRGTYDVERPPHRYDVARNMQLLAAATAVVWTIGFLLPLGASARNRGVVPLPTMVGLMTVLMAVPLAGLARPERDRLTLLDRLRVARNQPSALDRVAYYDSIRATINNKTPIPAPGAVIDALTRRLAPRAVLLSNPGYSCALAALLDAYCVNPQEIYGHYYLSAEPYLARYRLVRDDGESWHPFFNATWPVDPRERTLLKDYGVQYLLADPEHAELIQTKLDALGAHATVELRMNGYVLHHFLEP